MSRRAPYDGIVVTTPVSIPYVRFSTRGAHWWIGRALAALVRDSGLSKDRFDGVCATSMSLAPDTAVGIVQHHGLTPRWLDFIPMGGVTGVVAMRRAARAVQAGDTDIVACVAGDTNHIDSFRQGLENFSQFGKDAVYPVGTGGPNASFAFLTDYYMRTYGARREDFGKMCVAQRENALAYPHALFKAPLTLEQYMTARPIAEPVHLFDCVMPCAGAEAYLVMREEEARGLGLSFGRILGTIERHNAFPDDPVQYRGGWAMDSGELYGMAGVSPDDIDFFETYDDYPVINMLQFEDLGFCAKGEAPDFVRSHSLTTGGSFPINTSGGQLSVGQAGGAGGFLGTVEAIRQVTGQALGKPVPDARIGLIGGYGMISYDRGVCSAAAILAAGD
ncbi:MAG: thiolase family protein [Rhodospirillaceae bacterium]|nr:thiolase family protein [Rhodospirillaceae bacterium]